MSAAPSDLAFLELSTFDAASAQGYDDTPDFRRDLWPLLVNRAAAIGAVLSWREASSGAVEVVEHGSLSAIDATTRDGLRERAHWGGHLSVFFATEDRSVLTALIALYRRPPELSMDLAALELPAAVWNALQRFLDRHHFLIGFGHDGDPVFLIGCRRDLAGWQADAPPTGR